MSIIPNGNSAKVTVPELLQRKSTAADSTNQKKITCLTAYDYPTARLMDEAGVDVVLVGDSVAMVVLGYESTLPLTMEESLHHTKALLRDARAVEAAGAFSIVLEGIPRELAAEITKSVRIPTIGIGAGPDCDGQILVLHDLLGLTFQEPPKFARRYANVGEVISQAVREYCADVQGGSFPSDAESYHAPSAIKAGKPIPIAR